MYASRLPILLSVVSGEDEMKECGHAPLSL
jgi:hypothetical protein